MIHYAVNLDLLSSAVLSRSPLLLRKLFLPQSNTWDLGALVAALSPYAEPESPDQEKICRMLEAGAFIIS